MIMGCNFKFCPNSLNFLQQGQPYQYKILTLRSPEQLSFQIDNHCDSSDKSHFLSLLPHTLTINKSIIYQVHPLTRYRLELLRNSQLYDASKGWIYAGNHNGVVQFLDDSMMDMTVDATMKTNFFTLRLMEIKHCLFRDQGMVNKVEKEEPVGNHNLFIKKYLNKFTNENTHSFEEHSHMSNNFILHYHTFIERTPQGLKRILEQHQRLNTQNRPRKGSFPQSIKSSAFSDKINQIEVKGQNRFAQKAHEAMQGQFVGSQSKLNPPFNSLNLKRKIRRSNGHQASNHVSHKKLFVKSRFYNEPYTERKTRDQKNEENEELQNENKGPNQEEMLSPPLEPLQLKKLTSEEVKVNFDLFSPDKLKNKKINLENASSRQQKKRKLLEQFERKRIEFKKRIDSQKLLGNPIPQPLTDRQLKRSNSMRSMRSVRSVRLTELQRLPEEKPWVKKEKEKTRRLQKKIMYILIVLLSLLLYIVMQPNRNLETEEILTQWEYNYMAQEREKHHQKRTKQKKTRSNNKK